MSATTASPDLLAEFFKALADPTRIRLLAVIDRCGELCVCDVESALDITQSRASRHLATLRRVGLLRDRREGAWVYYKLARPLSGLAAGTLRSLRGAWKDDPAVAADADRAAAVRGRRCGDC